jgi:hypothetical protein
LPPTSYHFIEKNFSELRQLIVLQPCKERKGGADKRFLKKKKDFSVLAQNTLGKSYVGPEGVF